MPRRLNEIGRKAYEVLIRCVEEAMEEDNPDYVMICALPLAKLAEAEMGSFFGYEGYPNYNTALYTAKRALEYLEKTGVAHYHRDDLEELRETLKDLGWLEE